MRIAEIQRFCMHDGPGVRTTVFFKGCPLRCAWCHNPETQKAEKEILLYQTKCRVCGLCASCKSKAHLFSEEGHALNRELCTLCGDCEKICPTNAIEIVGKDMTVEEVFEIVKKDKAFYGENGGVTISGGEPFMQRTELLSLLKLCKENGINTAVETSGYFASEIIEEAVKYIDIFLWDIKDMSPERHKKYTGVSNEKIISNLMKADSLNAKTRLRCILVNGVNTKKEHYIGLANLYCGLKNCEGIEFIPYHSYGGSKACALGLDNNGNDSWIPSAETVNEAKQYIKKHSIPLF